MGTIPWALTNGHKGNFKIVAPLHARHSSHCPKDEVRSIKLLHLLKEKNAPMNAYEATTLWHLKQAKKLREDEELGNFPGHIGRKTTMKTLFWRYNFENKLPFWKTIRLPSSGTVARITCHNAKATLQRLLTDPRIRAEDYLFFGGDPMAPPP